MNVTNPVRQRSLHRLAALVAMVVMSLAVAPAAVAASPNNLNKGSAPATVTVPMQLDCSSIPATAQAKAALRLYRACLGWGGVTTAGTVVSNCGSLSLSVANGGAGTLQWRGRITSTLGPFMNASYAGSWANITNNRRGAVSRSTFGFSSDWSDIFPINTGAGSAFGIIGAAAVQLWWGPWCISTIPVDSHTIVT
jgi:hypothetical protein